MRHVNLSLKAAFVGLALASVSAPAFAGPAETEYLHRMAGTWLGQGKISGAEAGTVSCRLTLTPSGDRLNYTGRCAYSGSSTPQSFSGRISYNDRTGAYESSSRGSTVAGNRSGSTLTFTMTQTDMRGRGTSTMSLSPSAIKVQFKMENTRSGESSQGSVPFSKA